MREGALCLLFMLLGLSVSARNPYLRQFGQRDGLPNLQVYDLHGAKDDLLYLGTADGLYRFNGLRFEKIPFATLPGSVSYLSETADGVLWCKDFSNRLFYLKNDSLRNFELPNAIKHQGLLVGYAIIDSVLYVASRTNLFRYDMRAKNLRSLVHSPDYTKNILDFKITGDYLALALNGKLKVYRLADFSLLMEHEIPEHNTDLTAADGLFYLGYRGVSSHPAFEINPKTRKFEALGHLPANVHSNFIRIWQNQIHWCTNQGVYAYDRTNKTFELVFLGNKRVSDITTDKRGNHWISTLDHSIYLYPYAALEIIWPFGNEDERITSLGNLDGRRFLAGSNQGSIWEVNVQGQRQKIFQGESYDQIQFMQLDAENALLYYTHGIYDLHRKKFRDRMFLGRSLAQDKIGNIVYTSGESVSMFGKDLLNLPIAQKYPWFERHFGKELRLRPQRARKLLYDRTRGIYLVGFIDGLQAYSVLGENYSITTNGGKALLVNDMLHQPDNSIWLGTIDQGIWIFNGVDQVTPLETNGKISGQFIKKMVANGDGFVWILTEKGLDLYNPITKEVKTHRQIFGLTNVYIFDMLISDGYLLLATDIGILRCPEKPDLERRAPKLNILGVEINGKPWELTQSTLPHDQKLLRINFLPIHFQSEGQVYLQYRLDRSDSTWATIPATNGQLNLYGLPPGTHHLELRLLANEIYSDVFNWEISVAYPVWLRWWFIGLLAVGIAGGTAMLSRAYNKRKSKNHQLRQDLAASQLTAMKAQMNPHFLYNVLNSIQGLIYADKKEEAADYLSKFSDLMRLTLNFSDRQWHEISEEISALELYLQLEAGRFGADFSYDVRIDEETKRANPEIPSMLIQPYVENAIKHGLLHKSGPKRLSIDFSLHYDIKRVIITIEDNGIGRKQSVSMAEKRRNHRSFATQSLQSRLQILNQLLPEPVEVSVTDKKNEQQQATGTLVMIQLPYKNQ